MSIKSKYVSIQKGITEQRPHCFKCGDCCIMIPIEVSQKEIDLISKRMNQKERKSFYARISDNWKEVSILPNEPKMVLSVGIGWIKPPCIFLRWKRGKGKERPRCKIYHIRPRMCRIFYCGRNNITEPLNSAKYTFEIDLSGKAGELLKEIGKRPDLMKEIAKAVVKR